MNIKKSDQNFGMAYISPKRADLPSFRKYMAGAKGVIDVRALGDFVSKQSDNVNTHMQFKHTRNGDVFEVYNELYPGIIRIIPCENYSEFAEESKPIFYLKRVKDWFKSFLRDNIKYEKTGNWDNLPAELKEAGSAADKMEKYYNKKNKI